MQSSYSKFSGFIFADPETISLIEFEVFLTLERKNSNGFVIMSERNKVIKNPKYKKEWDANKKLENDPRITKVGKNIKTIGMLIGIATMLGLIFVWSPKCTEVTNNFATWLYELDEESIVKKIKKINVFLIYYNFI
mgnify:CR=1 FL=1